MALMPFNQPAISIGVAIPAPPNITGVRILIRRNARIGCQPPQQPCCRPGHRDRTPR